MGTQLLKGNNITSEMRYLIYPYFFPHLMLFGQVTNAYLMHCLYGAVQTLGAKKVLIVVNVDNATDLKVKLSHSGETGYYFKYSFPALFKQVDDEFVTMPSVLPLSGRDAGVKLQE